MNELTQFTLQRMHLFRIHKINNIYWLYTLNGKTMQNTFYIQSHQIDRCKRNIYQAIQWKPSCNTIPIVRTIQQTMGRHLSNIYYSCVFSTHVIKAWREFQCDSTVTTYICLNYTSTKPLFSLLCATYGSIEKQQIIYSQPVHALYNCLYTFNNRKRMVIPSFSIVWLHSPPTIPHRPPTTFNLIKLKQVVVEHG